MTTVEPRRRHQGSVSITVDVDSWDIEEAGYHHEDDCPATEGAPTTDREELHDAVQVLHEQAHSLTNDALFSRSCTREPCWGLYGTRGVRP